MITHVNPDDEQHKNIGKAQSGRVAPTLKHSAAFGKTYDIEEGVRV